MNTPFIVSSPEPHSEIAQSNAQKVETLVPKVHCRWVQEVTTKGMDSSGKSQKTEKALNWWKIFATEWLPQRPEDNETKSLQAHQQLGDKAVMLIVKKTVK